MEELREMLENSIEWYGKDDLITIMLSQKLDKYMVKEQLKKC